MRKNQNTMPSSFSFLSVSKPQRKRYSKNDSVSAQRLRNSKVSLLWQWRGTFWSFFLSWKDTFINSKFGYARMRSRFVYIYIFFSPQFLFLFRFFLFYSHRICDWRWRTNGCLLSNLDELLSLSPLRNVGWNRILS